MNVHEMTRTVRDLAVEVPGATRLFEKVGIDYCCGGAKSLEAACAERGLDPASVAASLDELVAGTADASASEPSAWSLSVLADHIVDKHHVFTRDELARLGQLLDKVVGVHGARHPELAGLRDLFVAVAEDLVPHMTKEEMVLFPYIKDLERAATTGRARPTPFFGTVRNPVRMMMLEHDTVGELLVKMREITADYTAPADACISYQTLYGALAELERDLHEHIHLENNILFPRAVDLESRE